MNGTANITGQFTNGGTRVSHEERVSSVILGNVNSPPVASVRPCTSGTALAWLSDHPQAVGNPTLTLD
ncbi:hypothetical protein [Pseudonocardia acaciae]|uniref:hypothetical protein n=1 Tax=Pseudonocardia acaciae TaxID=551276 RepID=UPI001B809392